MLLLVATKIILPISNKINLVAFHLNLPTYDHMHDVFNVSLNYKPMANTLSPNNINHDHDPLFKIEVNEEFEVHVILDSNKQGCTSVNNQEPSKNLIYAQLWINKIHLCYHDKPMPLEGRVGGRVDNTQICDML